MSKTPHRRIILDLDSSESPVHGAQEGSAYNGHFGSTCFHWQHLRTTNVIESPFASVRLRTDAAKRYKKVANATALIWRVLMVAEKRFRNSMHPIS